MARNHRKVWVGKKCVFCGGKRPAEDCEHSPPRVLFRGQSRPKGWEFPSCKRCNNGPSSNDTLAAVVAYSQARDAIFQSKPLSEDMKKLVDGFGSNFPFPYKQAQPVPIYDQSNQTWKSARHCEFTNQAATSLALWSAKQSLAMWYEFTSSIASHHCVIDVLLLTNTRQPNEELEQAIHKLGPSSSMSTKNNVVDKNFSYKFQLNSPKNLAAMFAQYHSGFAFVSIITDRRSAKLRRRGLQYKFSTNGHRGIHRI
ncbi:hypothetical protein [Epibacterium ulvae]|uniref:hypothetical protein n=1 Tax=Epibacterium ulvae TaxID=1156985 RepID=UPI00249275F6|nr:hypothetical protein [Epibacterium ulvae]